MGRKKKIAEEATTPAGTVSAGSVEVASPVSSAPAVAKKSAAVASPRFEADGVVYEFKIKKFMFQGRVYTAEQAATNATVLAHLVKLKSGVITRAKGG